MITQEHIDNNAAVRRILLERGVVPEDLPAEEDVKKVERRLASEKKKQLKTSERNDLSEVHAFALLHFCKLDFNVF